MDDKLTVEASAGHIPAGQYIAQITNLEKSTHVTYGVSYMAELTILDAKTALNEAGEEFKLRGRRMSKRLYPQPTTNNILGKVFMAAGFEVKVGMDFTIGQLINKQVGVITEDKPGEGKHVGKTFTNPITFFKVDKELPPITAGEVESAVVQKSTTAAVPAVAPDAEANDFAKGIEGEGAEKGQVTLTEAEAEVEAADLEAAAAVATAKAARARVDAGKK